MAAQLVDLHLHSTFSDGRYTPTMLVDEAVAKGIGVIAITDHDSWNGMAEACEAAKRYGASSPAWSWERSTRMMPCIF